MPALTDEDKVIRNDVGKRIAAAIEDLSAPEAEKVSYDNTESGMTADNTQDAIDELKSDIDSVELEDLNDINLTSLQDEDELHYDLSTSKWKNIAKKIYEKSVSGSLVSFNDGGDNIPLKSLIANITAVQSGSGTPSPSNVRAISGWSACNLNATGKNMWSNKFSDYTKPDNYYILPIPLEVGKTYTAFATLKSTTVQNIFLGYVKDGDRYTNFVGLTPIINSSGAAYTRQIIVDNTFTNPKLVFYGNETTFNQVFANFNIQLEEGNQATAYEPYNSTTHNIPFGQTVYGGVLDVLAGVLTVTHGRVDLGSLSWNEPDTSSIFSASIPGMKIPASAAERRTGIICSIYPVSSGTSINSSMDDKSMLRHNGLIYIRNTSYSDSATFTSSVTGQTLVYELATPVTYQLTPAQVSTLLGLNNIFADTGDISLSYFTQNANAINDIAESNTRTALNTDVPKTDLTDIFVTGTKNNTGATIAVGTYFYVNNQLALCKQAISANADLTLNTNYELVTAGALNKLMSNVNNSFHAIDINEDITSSTDLAYTGVSVSIPANSYFNITARAVQNNSQPVLVSINNANQVGYQVATGAKVGYLACASFSGYTNTAQTFYIFAQYLSSNSNPIRVNGFYVTMP